MTPWRTLRVGLLLLALVPAPAAAVTPHRVLVLQSFGRGFEPFTIFASAFRTELARTSPEPIEVHEISLETALFGEAQSEGPFVEYLISFDAHRRIDLVVAIGGPAARFVQRNRGRLFPSTPLLIAGVDERHIARAALTANDAVVPLSIDLRGAVENIVRVLPATTDVVVVLGRSPLEQFWVGQMRHELEGLADRLRVTFLDDLSLDEILTRAAALPSGTAIFYGLLVVDAAGVPHEQERALTEVHAVSRAPIFGLYEHQLGAGIVGGPLISIEGAGRETAGAAGRILHGEPPSSIRTPPIGPGVPTFDFREVARWNIDPARLPAGSVIRFRQPSFWDAYKWGILAVAAIGGVESALIVVLLVNLKGRRRAEDGLRRSREQYALAIEGSNDGLWDWNIRTDEVFFSQRCKRMLGYDDHEVANRFASWDERVHPEDRQRVTAALRSHVEGRKPAFRIEHRLRHKDGGYRWILARGKVQRDDEGHPYRMTGSLTDVTERKLAEQALRDVSRRLIVVQEEERARLARELHDDVTQRLARLAIDAGRVEQAGADGPATATMREVREGLVRLSEDIHALSYRLHPSLLEDLGLPDALQAECDRFSRQAAVPAELRLRGLPQTVPPGVSICLFRIAQEALHNVGRHSRAGRVELTLQGLDGGLQLAVRDDGVGFDPALARGRPSLGHASMRERVQLVGGEIDIESAVGQGTTIVAWVPLDEGRS